MKIRAVSKGRFSLLAALCAMVSGMASAQSVSTYGTPGLLELPSAEMFDDGTLAFTAAGLRDTGRATMTFQMLPWVHGSFRYAYIKDFDGDVGDRYDRSFDIHFRLREESRNAPAVVLGLRDFGGTGLYAAEYIVATKTFRDPVQADRRYRLGASGRKGGVFQSAGPDQQPVRRPRGRERRRHFRNRGSLISATGSRAMRRCLAVQAGSIVTG